MNMERVFNFLFGSVRSALTTLGLLLIILVSMNPEMVITPMERAAGNIMKFLGELLRLFGPVVITIFIIVIALRWLYSKATK